MQELKPYQKEIIKTIGRAMRGGKRTLVITTYRNAGKYFLHKKLKEQKNGNSK